MKLVKCDKVKGHFYDAEKYDGCPHCGAAQLKEKKRVPVMPPESFEQLPKPSAVLGNSDETAFLSESAPDVTADFSDDSATEELFPEEYAPKAESAFHCELVADGNNASLTLCEGQNNICVINGGLAMSIAPAEAQASITCAANGASQITPLGGGRVYLNGYYLMTTCPVRSGDRLTIGGASCLFLQNDGRSRGGIDV